MTKKMIKNLLIFSLLLTVNFVFAQTIGFDTAADAFLTDIKAGAVSVILICILFLCIYAIQDYIKHKDAWQAIQIVLWGALVVVVIVGGFTYMKGKLKF